MVTVQIAMIVMAFLGTLGLIAVFFLVLSLVMIPSSSSKAEAGLPNSAQQQLDNVLAQLDNQRRQDEAQNGVLTKTAESLQQQSDRLREAIDKLTARLESFRTPSPGETAPAEPGADVDRSTPTPTPTPTPTLEPEPADVLIACVHSSNLNQNSLFAPLQKLLDRIVKTEDRGAADLPRYRVVAIQGDKLTDLVAWAKQEQVRSRWPSLGDAEHSLFQPDALVQRVDASWKELPAMTEPRASNAAAPPSDPGAEATPATSTATTDRPRRRVTIVLAAKLDVPVVAFDSAETAPLRQRLAKASEGEVHWLTVETDERTRRSQVVYHPPQDGRLVVEVRSGEARSQEWPAQAISLLTPLLEGRDVLSRDATERKAPERKQPPSKVTATTPTG